ncbi:NACHT domain-containing protein [Nostoc sp. CHAB 5844]|nr:NACHT domain-containing protein [Nostoc sp. CHAB 5844]
MGSLNNLDYEEIASQTSFAVNYLQRCVAPQLWDLLSEVLGGEGSERVGKKRLWYFLAQLNKKYNIQTPMEESAFLESPSDEAVPVLGILPEIPNFYGRSKELAHLKLLIAEHRCISLVGMPGVGKSALAAKLISELCMESQPRFELVIWKSVSHAPLLHDLIVDLVSLTKDPLDTELVTSPLTHGMISVLLKQLQSRRCLLVLDGFEALFKGNNFIQRLEYGTFLNRLIEENHNSCLLLTSRILIDEIDILAKNKPYNIKTLKVNGLDVKAAKQLLFKLGLKNEEDCKDLIATYYGNPQELKAVSKRIERFFCGSARKFLEAKTTLISTELHSILNEMFGQILSNIQRQIMLCIAEELFLTCQPISFSKLLEKLKLVNLSVSTSELIAAIENLERLSLIETGKDESTKETWFNLQPVVKKYIKTDPLGLVHTSEASPNLAIAS